MLLSDQAAQQAQKEKKKAKPQNWKEKAKATVCIVNLRIDW
jgi:SOS response regulatory protein OraA/RecX